MKYKFDIDEIIQDLEIIGTWTSVGRKAGGARRILQDRWPEKYNNPEEDRVLTSHSVSGALRKLRKFPQNYGFTVGHVTSGFDERKFFILKLNGEGNLTLEQEYHLLNGAVTSATRLAQQAMNQKTTFNSAAENSHRRPMMRALLYKFEALIGIVASTARDLEGQMSLIKKDRDAA